VGAAGLVVVGDQEQFHAKRQHLLGVVVAGRGEDAA
jgi:hypothetical protein